MKITKCNPIDCVVKTAKLTSVLINYNLLIVLIVFTLNKIKPIILYNVMNKLIDEKQLLTY